jgi:hypothetical protein
VTQPDDLGPLPLRQVREYLTVDGVHVLLHAKEDLGPVNGQVGTDEVYDLTFMFDQGDQENRHQVVRRAEDVISRHVAARENRTSEPTVDDRRAALTTVATRVTANWRNWIRSSVRNTEPFRCAQQTGG